jgi:hypothetical protein
MKVIYKKVGEFPEVREIEPKLEEYQKLVDGYIECVYLDYIKDPYLKGYILVCNEEGKICDMDANIEIPHDYISGDFFIVKDSEDGTDFESVLDEDIQHIVTFINLHRIDL